MYGQLTPDVPLGPFEGTPIAVWSGQGKRAKLHATPSCSYLRSTRGVERTVHLDASVVGRMCPQCGTYGSWARPGTGLAVFLDTLTGLGLLYELDSFRDPDEDAFEDEEVRHAAAVLYKPVADNPAVPAEQDDAEDDEDDTWEERQEAQRVRESVLRQWGGALASMHRTHRQLALFPWLRAWAGAALEAKAGYLRVLQEQARAAGRRKGAVGGDRGGRHDGAGCCRRRASLRAAGQPRRGSPALAVAVAAVAQGGRG